MSHGGRRSGAGRKKGIPNKNNQAITAMIDEALNEAGGAKYLRAQAEQNPAAFLALIGKRVPRVVEGPGEHGEHTFTFSWRST